MSFAYSPAAFADAAPVPVLDAAPALPRPLVVGLTGPGGVGKSTVARALALEWSARQNRARAEMRVIHTGEPLKAALRGLLAAAGMKPAEVARRLDGDLKRQPCAVLGGQTPTYAMQTLGTEWGRLMIAPDLWVGIWTRNAQAALDDGVAVVNDSVRFGNEVAAIHALGGVVVRLVGRAGDLAASHASEAGAPADFEVSNTGTPEATARAILDTLAARQIAAANRGGAGIWSRMMDLLTARADRAKW